MGNMLQAIWVHFSAFTASVKRQLFAFSSVVSQLPLFRWRKKSPKRVPPEKLHTPLRLAAARGDVRTICRLLESEDCDVNETCALSGMTPLLMAIMGGQFKAVVVLLEHGADINASTRSGSSALMMATREKADDNAIFRLLLDCGADVNHVAPCGTKSVLSKTITSGKVDLLELLLQTGVDLGDIGRNCLHRSPLVLAASQRSHRMVQTLLAHDPTQINESGTIALKTAVERGLGETVTVLIQNGAKLDPSRLTGTLAAMLSLKKGKQGVSVTGCLLDNGLIEDTSYCDNKGRTLLHYVFKYRGFSDVYHKMMLNGYEAHKGDHNGVTPFMLALKYIDSSDIPKDMYNQYDVLLTDRQGRSAFHYGILGVDPYFWLDKILIDVCKLEFEKELPDKREHTKECESLFQRFSVQMECLSKSLVNFTSNFKDESEPSDTLMFLIRKDLPGLLLTLIFCGSKSLRHSIPKAREDNKDLKHLFQKLLGYSILGNKWRCLRVVLHCKSEFTFEDYQEKEIMAPTLYNFVKRKQVVISRFDLTLDYDIISNCITWLLDAGADPLWTCKNGLTVVHLAALMDSPHLLKILFQNGIYIGKDQCEVEMAEHTPVGLSVQHYSTLNYLIQENYPVNKAGRLGMTPLHNAVMTGKEASVKLLLVNGADPRILFEGADIIPEFALLHSRENFSYDCISLLLDYGANVNGTDRLGMPGLLIALQNGMDRIVSLLIDYNCNVRTKFLAGGREWDPLVTALWHCPVSVPILLKAGVSVDVVIRCLHNPASDLEMCQCLLKLKQSAPTIHKVLFDSVTKVRPLLEIARICIRELLGPRPTPKAEFLPLPEVLKDYVLFKGNLHTVW